jgi:hypothetical protein
MSVAPSPPSVDLRWEVVQRVASSTSFQRSPRLRELLGYICERAIQNRPEDLREQLIGCGVFNRKTDYNTGEDNIVRVEMRQLRKRLDDYYAAEGKDEPFLIVIPKGTYVPVFEPREVVAPPVPIPEPVPPVRLWTPLRLWWFWAMTAAILVLLVACGWLLRERLKTVRVLTASTAPVLERAPLWPMLFNDGEETLVVCADSSLVVARALLKRSITLQEYTSNEFLTKPGNVSNEIKAAIRGLPNWQFTDIADVRLVQRLFRLNADHWGKVSVRSAKTTQVQDFKNGNSVLLGSNRSNLWNSLFEPMLNFRFEHDEQTNAALIRNKTPLPGEPSLYRAAPAGQSGDSYSVVALVPNLRHTGSVLIIEGSTGEGTEVAGEFIMNHGTSTALLNTLMAQRKGHIPYFEVLLRSGTLEGVAKNAEIVSTRLLPGDATHN